MLGSKDNVAYNNGATVTPEDGLCVTCNQVSHCMHRGHGPVWRCEEFDDSTAVRGQPELRTTPPAPERVAGRTTGICCNCEHRSTCALPAPEGGVWHCEEYA